MKRLLFALILITFVFCSCNSELNFLAYQDTLVLLECVVNDEFELTFKKNDEQICIEISAPSELLGLTLDMQNGTIYANSSDFKMPLEYESAKGIYALFNMIQLQKEQITAVESADKCSIVTFESSFGTYIITYGKNLLPQSIQINSNDFYYDISVSGIELK